MAANCVMTAETCVQYTIFQGNTGPVLKPRPSVLDDVTVLDADWHCYIAANNADGTVAIASREVTDKTVDNLRWIAALTPAETETLTVNAEDESVGYKVIIKVVNATTTPSFEVDYEYILFVKPQGMPSV